LRERRIIPASGECRLVALADAASGECRLVASSASSPPSAQCKCKKVCARDSAHIITQREGVCQCEKLRHAKILQKRSLESSQAFNLFNVKSFGKQSCASAELEQKVRENHGTNDARARARATP